MNKAKYTPGPWDQSMIGAVYRRTTIGLHNQLCVEVKGGDPFSQDETIANARLISAAPELLEALEMCALVLSGEEMTKHSLIKSLELAQNAMRKAKGDT